MGAEWAKLVPTSPHMGRMGAHFWFYRVVRCFIVSQRVLCGFNVSYVVLTGFRAKMGEICAQMPPYGRNHCPFAPIWAKWAPIFGFNMFYRVARCFIVF